MRCDKIKGDGARTAHVFSPSFLGNRQIQKVREQVETR